MSKRKIIKIDEAECNGCGLCIPNCPEGAIQIIDDKARLISDLFCDGLGACIGHCPQGAITIEEREAEEYGERKVMENIVKQGDNVIRAHLEHLKGHNQDKYLQEAIDFLKEKNIAMPVDEEERHSRHAHGASGCPGSKIMDFRKKGGLPGEGKPVSKSESELKTWPVQIMLIPSFAPYLNNADLLIAADCVPFAYAGFHRDLLKDKILLVGCPKLDDTQIYQEKINQILKQNTVKSITYAHMEVPCCFGLVNIINKAISESGKNVPFKEVTISIKGERLQ
ncbi:MAG: 4Fe-4S binding protein [Candidatus Omnitrophota bacterium]